MRSKSKSFIFQYSTKSSRYWMNNIFSGSKYIKLKSSEDFSVSLPKKA